MKRTVEVRAGVRDHLDLADLKLCTWSVMLFRLFATEKVTDDRRRQTFVSDQAVLDRVAKINELFSKYHRRHYIAPIPHSRLTGYCRER